MNDSVSRQAAIDALCKELYKYEDMIEKHFQESEDSDVRDWMLYRVFVKNISYIVRQTILKLPPAQLWTPLSTNQLPEEGQEVLIQFKDGISCPHFKVQVGYLGEHDIEDNNFRKIGVKKVWYTDEYYYDLNMVVAWMPRPELYKGEGARNDDSNRQCHV